jgi:CheY-like chemotaxis protein
MPEMDGFVATKLIRAQPRLQYLPIIAMTAHALVEERQRCMAAGMNDHVSKPIDPDALFATLMRWTRPSQGQLAQPQSRLAELIDEVILTEIEGVDTASGLKRVAGNARLYRKLLGQFAAEQCDAGLQISAALESGEQELAERIAHTVKGVAGNIGIEGVFTAAQKLERAIRERDPRVPSLLEEFTQLLNSQVQMIGRALSDAPAHQFVEGGACRAFDANAALAAITYLRALLEASDGDAIEAFVAVREILTGAVEEEGLNALGAATNNFDFATALLKLDDVAKRYGADGSVTNG